MKQHKGQNKVRKNEVMNLQGTSVKPESISHEIGHFNLFKLEPIDPKTAKPLPYKRRDFYKIMLVVGPVKFSYADREVVLSKPALVFSNPHIPYVCENLQNIEGGYYCIFSRNFFDALGSPEIYTVYQPDGNHIFELNKTQEKKVESVFLEMFEEFNSEYIHKYDLLRNLVVSLLHMGLKMQPTDQIVPSIGGASKRIAGLFMELLERQFPIEENHTQIECRSPSEFAKQLNIHVNHLNRAVKETKQKTTTSLIAERVLKESRILLRQSNLNVGEIAYALGFKESTHFNNFFKKQMGMSPLVYRRQH